MSIVVVLVIVFLRSYNLVIAIRTIFYDLRLSTMSGEVYQSPTPTCADVCAEVTQGAMDLRDRMSLLVHVLQRLPVFSEEPIDQFQAARLAGIQDSISYFDQVSNEFATLNSQLQAQQVRVSEEESHLKQRCADLEMGHDGLQILREQLEGKNAEVTGLWARLNDQVTKNSQLESQVTSKDKELSELRASREEQDNKLSRLNADHQILKDKFREKVSDSTRRDAELDGKTTKLSQCETELQSKTTKLSECENELKQQKLESSKDREEVSRLESEVNELKQKLDGRPTPQPDASTAKRPHETSPVKPVKKFKHYVARLQPHHSFLCSDGVYGSGRDA